MLDRQPTKDKPRRPRGAVSIPRRRRRGDSGPTAARAGGCHRDDLRGGDEGEPPLNGPIFVQNWEGNTVAALYDMVATDMPKSNPGSLPLTTCIDIVAFLLQSNGMPAGPAELTTDIVLYMNPRLSCAPEVHG